MGRSAVSPIEAAEHRNPSKLTRCHMASGFMVCRGTYQEERDSQVRFVEVDGVEWDALIVNLERVVVDFVSQLSRKIEYREFVAVGSLGCFVRSVAAPG